MVPFYEYDFTSFSRLKVQQKSRKGIKKGNKREYIDTISCFDIETTPLADIEQSVMYIWQWCINGVTVYGRTWEEFLRFVQTLKESRSGTEKLVVYVHNLSYEFQFLAGIYAFEQKEVFAVDRRKVLRCDMFDFLEFRCSYLHSNMSLATFLSKMGAKHGKLSGEEFDYKKQRFPWTILSDKELEYCENDVLGLWEALSIEMSHDGDNLYTVPATSTGYVRRDCREAMRSVSHWYVEHFYPEPHVYVLLREAFRGGNTHANRFYAGKVLHNVVSYDRCSSYPDVMVNCKFPMGEFIELGPTDPDDVIRKINIREKAILARVTISGLRLKDQYWGCPYLSRSKCRGIENGAFDNGRVLEAEYLETTITDIDLRIIMDEYIFDDIAFPEVYEARYGKLPAELIGCVLEYFEKKTTLKNVDGQELLYMKSKNKLNSIYGMTVQDPAKQSTLFDNGEWIDANEDVLELLDKNKKRAFLVYQWGVWVTAWARYRLEQGLKIAGDGFVYCDTDSVKFVKTLGNGDFTAFNMAARAADMVSGAHAADPHGEEHFLGVYECETGSNGYYEFSTLGAKKYVSRETSNSPLQITIAGVIKRKGAAELEAAGGISAFKPGFTFRKGGGTESVYNDDVDMMIQAEGRPLHVTRNLYIKDSTYTLGLTDEYRRLLFDCDNKLLQFMEVSASVKNL